MNSKVKVYHEKQAFLDDIDELDKEISDINGSIVLTSSRQEMIKENIETINQNLINTKKNNIKRTLIKNVKIMGRVAQFVLPYVIVTGLSFGGFKLLGTAPFYREKKFYSANHVVTLDNQGLYNDDASYEQLDNRVDKVYYSSKWEKKIDGKYYRTIKETEYLRYDLDELREMVKDPNFDFKKSFENDYYYSSRVKTTHEVKDSVSEEELAQGDYLKIVTSYVDYDDVIYIEQSEKEDLFESIFYSVLLVLLFALVFFGRKITTEFDFLEACKELKDRYKNINVDELIKLFNEKKIKFERVYHQQLALVDPITNEQITIKR
jgi:hypothetical protein